jgi:hypothetical protein
MQLSSSTVNTIRNEGQYNNCWHKVLLSTSLTAIIWHKEISIYTLVTEIYCNPIKIIELFKLIKHANKIKYFKEIIIKQCHSVY